MNKYKIKKILVSKNDNRKVYTIRVHYPEKVIIRYTTKNIHAKEYETMQYWSEEDWIGYILRGMCEQTNISNIFYGVEKADDTSDTLVVFLGKEEIKNYYDMSVLYPLGYRIVKYEATKYKEGTDYGYIIDKSKSNKISTFINKSYEKITKESIQ